MEYYTSEDIKKLKELGMNVNITNGTEDHLNMENLYVEVGKRESGYVDNLAIKKIDINLINREECRKIMKYIKEHEGCNKDEIEKQTEINFDVNCSIHALINKKYIIDNNGCFFVSNEETEFLA